MQRAHDGADRQLALEAEPEIGHHGEDREDDADRARLHELARDTRANGLDPLEVVAARERLARLGDNGALSGLAARLDREAQRDAALIAEFLHLDVAEPEGIG